MEKNKLGMLWCGMLLASLVVSCSEGTPTTGGSISASNAKAADSSSSTSTSTATTTATSTLDRCAALGVYATRIACESAQAAACSSAVFSWGSDDIACWKRATSSVSTVTVANTITVTQTQTQTSTVSAVSPSLYAGFHVESNCTSYRVISKRADGVNESRAAQVNRISSFSVCRMPVPFDKLQAPVCPSGWRPFTRSQAGLSGTDIYMVVQKPVSAIATTLGRAGLATVQNSADVLANLEPRSGSCIQGACAPVVKLLGKEICLGSAPTVCSNISYIACKKG